MKDKPIFTNSTEIYDLLKPLGYDVVLLPDGWHREPPWRKTKLVAIDELNDWIEARGGWPKVPEYQSARPHRAITVYSGSRGGGMSLSMLFAAAEIAHKRNLWGDR